MSEAVKKSTKRIYKWDNLKCFLIVMVVIGHFVNQYAPISNTMKSLSLFIYSFHMPLFIFLSGLLQKYGHSDVSFNGTNRYIIL